MPVQTRKALDKIRQRFLWGGSEEKSKIHWVRWELVCKDKEHDGLGIKSLEEFNLALLSKWKWIILVKNEASWKKIMDSRYIDYEDLILSNNSCKTSVP